MSKMIEMDGYTYTLPFTVDVANNDLVDAKGGYFGMRSASPEELVTIAAALNDYRPWRYPSRGEFPEIGFWYEVSVIGWDGRPYINVGDVYSDGTWMNDEGLRLNVYAWRELAAPAPVIETEDGR